MDSSLIWIIIGIVLALAEIALPGGIVFFLGLAALLVGIGGYLGLITSLVSAILSWFIISILLLLFIRSYFMKYFEGDSSVHNVDEKKDYKGAIVEVIEDILPHIEGRIKYQGSTWNARSDFEIKAGQKAIVIGRDGLSYIVKNL